MNDAGSVRLRASAKVNLGLEVLGRRHDGYHELVSVLQTIALWDELDLTPAKADHLVVEAPPGGGVPEGTDNLAWRAVRAHRAAAGVPGLHIRLLLRKRVPAAGGLGGGSSDAAAVLRGLQALTPPPLGPETLAAVAADLGSDVPFFLRGGAQLAEGRGERLMPLPDIDARWLILVTPEFGLEGKTARLFGMLDANDFSDGSHVRRLAAAITRGEAIDPSMLVNTFARVARCAFPGLDRNRDALVEVCGHAALSGAGPSLFALTESEHAARTAAAALSARGVSALAVRTLGAAESTRVESRLLDVDDGDCSRGTLNI